jgi:chemotaxis protein MotB
MAAHGKGKKRGLPVEHENEERWLLTYADMLTLLFALFMVLFSISSVNISKYQVLQQSLKAAFSGSILPGGRAILQSGSESTAAHTPATAVVPSIVPLMPTPTSRSSSSTGSANAFTSAQSAASAQPMTSAQLQAALNSMSASVSEQNELVGLQHRLETYAKAHGFANQVKAIVDRRGLVVQVLTDNLLFQSGQATLQPAGLPLLNEVAQLLNVDQSHPITVEGYTDNIPIHSAEFPSNWELSTTRATTVVQYLISRGVNENRLGAAGYADLHPVASNATAAGRALNRRVDIVIERLNPEPPTS